MSRFDRIVRRKGAIRSNFHGNANVPTTKSLLNRDLTSPSPTPTALRVAARRAGARRKAT